MILWNVLGLFFSCSSQEQPHVELMKGRYGNQPIYQAEVPNHWIKLEQASDLSDTRMPIATYKIGDGLLTVHNFPYASFEERIPPEAQIQRWKKQFPKGIHDISSVAHGGFGGFRLETEEMIGYAMQLSPLIFKALHPSEIDKRADYTIKFVGPVVDYRHEVDLFAISFEWTTPLLYERL